MKRTFTTMAAAAAVCALVSLPASAQSSGSGSAGSGSSQQGGSSGGSGATDQQGSTQGDQVGSGGAGQSGSGQTGTSGQSGTGQSGSTGGSAPGSKGSPAAKGSSQDRTFIMEAAAGGMAEVELGRLATQKASRSEVKEFGQMMVDDHTKANDKLMKIAQDKGLAAPEALKPQDKATEERLSKLSGEAFDRAYMQHMVKDHQKDVVLFRKQSTGAADADVKQFASSTLPTLEKHLSRAQEVEQIVGRGTARGTSGSKGTGHSGTSGSGSAPSGSGTTPPQR